MNSCTFSFYSSAAHSAKAWPLLNLLCQYTPWAVKMSVTPSQYTQHFHPNFPNYRENITLAYFENFLILHSCFRPTCHANTHQGGLYTIMPHIGLRVCMRVRACVYPDIHNQALATWHNVTCLPLSYNRFQTPHGNREMYMFKYKVWKGTSKLYQRIQKPN